ncbi:MAG: sensor histidine kinase, partial [Parahaliea sp.]
GIDFRQCFLQLALNNEAFECEGETQTGGRNVLIRGGGIYLDIPVLVFTLSDITATKASERSRIEALNFVSHDLRAPLISVLALIDHARSSQSGREAEALLNQIEYYIRSNLGYAESFVQLSRFRHAPELDMKDCDAQDVVDEAVAQLIYSARSKRIALLSEPVDEDVWVLGNHGLLVRACLNLLDNAIKISPEGARVFIRVYRQGHCAVFEFEDEGSGIEKGDIERIFKPFQHGGGAKSGAGLGLRFVAAVAQQHQGKVEVDSETGRGSRFRLYIPATDHADFVE